jgi:predicted permease
MWWTKRRTDEDFSREIDAHLSLEADRLVDDGLPPDAARDAARRAFGNTAAARERFHEANHWVWFEQLAQDLRYAVRGLWHARVFAATTVLTLAVGLGLVTVVFAIFNAYVLRPFAVRDPYSLHRIVWTAPDAFGGSFRWQEYQELRDRHDLFSDVTAEATRYLSSANGPVSAALVSGNYFESLGARVRLGRPLASFDAGAPGSSPVAVLSDEGWARFFDRDPAVLGQPIELNGERFVIVGVMQPEFSGLDDTPRDVWVPVTMYSAVTKQDLAGTDQPRELVIVARLARGVTAAHVRDALTPMMARISERADVRAEALLQATPNPLSFRLVATLSPVFAAFLLVLVAACANVSNVMLARANARHREIAVRLALGASRGRLIRQLLTEGLLVAVLSGLAALALASATLRAGTALFFATLPPSIAALVRVAPLDFDFRVFLFALVVASGATLLFALAPALRATRLSLTHALRGQPSATTRAATLRNGLVASQVAVSLVLLVGAVTLARNGVQVGATDLGLDTAGVASVNQRGQEGSYIRSAAEALAVEPRIASVAVTSRNPLFGEFPKMPVTSTMTAGVVATPYMFVSPEYFPMLRIPIVRGREFRPEEARSEARVGIISAAGAKALWPGTDPLGQVVRIRIDPPATRNGQVTRIDRLATGTPAESADVVIVGVAGDVVSGLVFEGRDPSHLYLPTSPEGSHAGAILLRGRSRQDAGTAALQSILRKAHPDPLVFEVMPLDEMREAQMYPLRTASWIGSLLGAIALVLSVSGLYGVLTYTLSQRTREIGIRMALGATSAAVLRMVMTQSARLAGAGAAIGLAVALAVMKVLSNLITLQNVSVLDMGAFAASLALVAVATALAAYGPARRATRVDPAETLRAEG